MTEGRFSNLEVDEYKAGAERAASPGGDGKHFVQEMRGADYYLRQATSQALDGEHEKALRSYASALGEDPLRLEAWVGQVRMLLELGEYPEARLWADKAMERFPKQPELVATKSIALFRMGHEREARGMNDVALQQKGEFEIVWLARGEILLGGDGSASEECLEHAKRLSADGAATRLYIGGLYLRYGHYSRALSALRDATREIPQASWAWYQLGRAQVGVGDHEQAQVSFREARKLNRRSEVYRSAAAEPPRPARGWLEKLFGRFRSP